VLGNRASSTDVNKGQSQYTYNALNQLISRVGSVIDEQQSRQGQLNTNISTEERYTYDKRGNLTETYQGNNLINQYHFGALNRLEKAVNHQTKEASEYMYNGLGHRVGKTIGAPVEGSLPTDKLANLTINPMKRIEDTIDLTKQYHNLLQRTEDNNTTSFTWDSNVLRATGNSNNTSNSVNDGTGNNNYNQYLQDELGSPIRLFSPNSDVEEIYSYDEFGQELHHKQGTNSQCASAVNPFTYTGYQRDSIANTYYAQAREYKPEVGRFTGEDIIKGSIVYPDTINHYAYCWNDPMGLVDLDGALPSFNDIKNGAKSFAEEVKKIDLSNTSETKVLTTNYVSGYKGQLVVRWTPGGRAASFGPVILANKKHLKNDKYGKQTIQHEGGHYVQYKELGATKYFLGIMLPSMLNGNYNPYYDQPWEVSADVHGNVNRPHVEGTEALGEAYMDYLKSICTAAGWFEFLASFFKIVNHDTSLYDGSCP